MTNIFHRCFFYLFLYFYNSQRKEYCWDIALNCLILGFLEFLSRPYLHFPLEILPRLEQRSFWRNRHFLRLLAYANWQDISLPPHRLFRWRR